MYVSIIATVAAVAVAAPYVIVRAKLNIGLYSSTISDGKDQAVVLWQLWVAIPVMGSGEEEEADITSCPSSR